ncbi:MAG: ATP-binding protein [Labedaea sp.]
MKRWGLRGRMTASYLLVTAAAVLVVEIVVALLISPGLVAGPNRKAAASLVVQRTAQEYATRAVDANARLGHLPTDQDIQLGEQGTGIPPGATKIRDGRAVVPFIGAELDDNRPMPLALLLDPQLKIVASSYPARYPVGKQIGGSGIGPLPVGAISKFVNDPGPIDGQVTTPNGEVLMSIVPVPKFTAKAGLFDKTGAGKPVDTSIGSMYVQVPATKEMVEAAAAVAPGTGSPWDDLSAQLAGGVAVLVGALPVGVVFGLLSTRPLIRRLRRLATSTVAVADGHYQHRVPVSGSDEITTLENNFNRMAARLSDTMTTERHLASAGERARIARELHDSISQDLFSIRLLAGGLRRALPAESPLHPQVEAMERTATGTMHEMQALLLELRPIALRDAGLSAAVDELCQAYTDRLGVAVTTELESLDLDPAVEHAVLRIVQEALANAVKHARPNRITMRIKGNEADVLVSVTDDGNGFDPARAAERHGMGLSMMRERATELGGDLEFDSAPGRGTTVQIRLPRHRP